MKPEAVDPNRPGVARTWRSPRGKWLVALPFVALFALGLPALGARRVLWFSGDPAATLYVLLLAAMWLGATAISRPERRRGPAGGSRLLVAAGLLAPVPLTAYDRVFGTAAARPLSWTLFGLLCCATSALLGLWAVRALGEAYAPDPTVLPGQRLITDGIYRHLRHPIYTAALLWTAGLPLLVGSVSGAGLGLALVGAAVCWRIPAEEAMLRRAFGEAYRAYQVRTWRLIPFVW